MTVNDLIYLDENEKPLDRIAVNGGFCGTFKTICCVGDSLSSGELESIAEDGTRGYHDYYEYSWGQFIARMAGSKVYNFSKGGMSAREYCKNFADKKGLWNEDLACQAYIIALGVNDLNSGIELGSVDDIDLNDCENNKDTFAGYYGKIIQKYKAIQPDAKFFFVTIPRENSQSGHQVKADRHSEILYDLTKMFDNSYVIDLRKYAPVYDEVFKKKFYLEGHMSVCGYIFTANIISSYIDYIIRHNMKDFKQAGFIGTPYVRDPEKVNP